MCDCAATGCGSTRREVISLGAGAALALALAVLPDLAEASEAPFSILTRSQWGARDALPGGVAHEPDTLVVHHTARLIDMQRRLASKLRGLQRWSQSSEPLADGTPKIIWSDLPYHFYVSWDGIVAEGRDPLIKGDTNTAYDPTGCLQICLEGNFEIEWPTVQQILALERLVLMLRQQFSISSPVKTHKELTVTQCPGRNFDVALARLRP
jgi:hypothetical protein